MKNLNYLNYFFVGLPIILCLLWTFDQRYLYLGLLSTMLTGAYQVIIGLKMLIQQPKDRSLHVYFAAVILFFAAWLFLETENYNIDFMFYLFGIPPTLAIYFSIILYKKAFAKNNLYTEIK